MLGVTFALVPLALAPLASAWGPLGHATVAGVAANYLLPEASKQVKAILAADPDQTGTTLQTVASWADDYRYTSAGRFSEPYHFVDAQDSPPQSCGVDIERDCGKGGCVIAAISNYTQRIQDPGLDDTDRAQALKFITHFLGDITQPLHDEAEELGGNDIEIKWKGKKQNLHHIWDTDMITKFIGTFTTSNVSKWSKAIVNELTSGDYKNQLSDWISCVDPSDSDNCALGWATDANAYVCSYVLKTDPSGKEMDGDYYTGATPIIQQQIAKGGVRLAAWLNMIFAGETGF